MPSNSQLLRLINVPVFKTVDELSVLSGLSRDVIQDCLYSKNHYSVFDIPKKNGSIRRIYEPDKNLKAIQRWILRNILDRFSPTPQATAFCKGSSLTSNVFPHINHRYFFSLDLKDFFPSIRRRQIKKIFSVMGYTDKAARILASLCTYEGFLPQGAVTSPSLSNLVAVSLDKRLNGYASKRNIIYTRYADDITFSSNKHSILFKMQGRVTSIIGDEGFTINSSKVRFTGPRRQSIITGLVKNAREPRFSIGHVKYRTMRAVMFRFLSKGPCDDKFGSIESIEGYLAFLKGVDLPTYNKLSKYWVNLKIKGNRRVPGTF